MLKYKIYKEVELDDPKLTIFHRKIIKEKPFLRKIYLSWYQFLINEVKNSNHSTVIEIGSGGGFLKEIFPAVITSDIEKFEHCDMTFSATNMPFENESVDCIFMVNVFHHIPDAELFLNETNRVLKDDGKLIMVEPSICFWSKLIYKYIHHENMDLKANWKLPQEGRLSEANIALPWIVFNRDKEILIEKYNNFQVLKTIFHTPIAYLLSGGVSFKFSLPGWSYKLVNITERLLTSIFKNISMFQTIIVSKRT